MMIIKIKCFIKYLTHKYCMDESDRNQEIFKARGNILIKDALLSDRTVDIYIDEDGRIAEIGEDIGRKYAKESLAMIDGHGQVVIPGLVNTHTHAAMTLLRGYADDMPLQEWLTQKIWPLEAHLTGSDVYWGTKLACLEMIRTGTVAFNDHYFFMEEAACGVNEMGMRAVLAHALIDRPEGRELDMEIKKTENLVRTIHGLNSPLIKPAVGPHSVYTVSKEGLKWCAEYAQGLGIGIHIHLSENRQEIKDSETLTGERPSQVLKDTGCLTDRTVAAHCCMLKRWECELLGERGVHVSHNPTSNMKLASEKAMPYHWLKKAGVNVSIGTDGCASNNNLDLFEEMKFAALLQKFARKSATVITAQEVLEMSTLNGYRALGFEGGVLTPGAPADIVLVATGDINTTPCHNSTSNLVYVSNGLNVTTTICNGRVLMYERYVPGQEEILREARAAATDLVRRRQADLP